MIKPKLDKNIGFKSGKLTTIFGMSNIVKSDKWVKGEDLCNRKACQSSHKVAYWNETMQAYYCPTCARLLNNEKEGLCKLDNKKLNYEVYHKDEDRTYSEYLKSEKAKEN